MCRFLNLVACLCFFFTIHAARATDPDFRVTSVRFFPAPGLAEKMKGGRFTGSNTSATNDFVEFARIENVPPEGEWTQIEVSPSRAFRFIKYEGPNGSFGAVAEIEFRSGDQVLKGEAFGTAGARNDGETVFSRALDGSTETFFEGKEANNQYVGWDLGPESQVKPLTVSVAPGQYPEPLEVELRTETPDATIYVNLKGQVPRAEPSAVVSGPIRLESNALLMAFATKEGLADTPLFVGVYRIGEPPADRAGIRTFHIGNSLTDTINQSLQPLAASAGKVLEFHRFTIPGAPTDWLWNHPGSGFGDNRYVEAFQVLAPIDHITTQPFAGHNRSVENEAEFSGKFFAEARKSSPEIQPWLYVQWPGPDFQDAWSQGRFDKPEGMEVSPATTYPEAVENHLRYHEVVRDEIMKSWDGKPIRIIPAGKALAVLHDKIAAGGVPGMDDFFKEIYADGIHMTKKGQYLVSLVFYACLFAEDPTGKVSALDSGLTDEQAEIFQKIAWDVAKSYPHSGVAP